MVDAKRYTNQYDFALQKLGSTGDRKYEAQMDTIERRAGAQGLTGMWERDRSGNNKMFRFKKR